MSAPELAAKPIGIITPHGEVEEFEALSREQKGYFLHWARSNQRKLTADWWENAMRRAKE